MGWEEKWPAPLESGNEAQWYRICLPMQETQVQSLRQEKGKEKWQPTPVFLSRDPWTEEPGGLSD